MSQAGGNRYEYANGVLRNTFGITDAALLQQAETTFVAIRQSELALQAPAGQFDLNHLKAIHHFLFQDIYDWAGEIRQVDISKGNSPFAHFGYIESNALTLFARLAQEHYLCAASPTISSCNARRFTWEKSTCCAHSAKGTGARSASSATN